MALSLDEALGMSLADEADESIHVNVNTRQITIPESQQLFGVESDADVEVKHIVIDGRYADGNRDLSKLAWRVIYRNANKETSYYLIPSVVANENSIEMDWLIKRSVVAYKGTVDFILCAFATTSSGEVTPEWNSTLGQGIVLEGLETSAIDIGKESVDELSKILYETITARDTAVKSAKDADNTANSIKDSMTQIGANKEAVSRLKEDTTALQKRQNVLVGSETGNPVSCNDAYSAPLCGLTVYGKSTQDGTPTPDNPVPIVSVGDGGTILVTVGDGADGQQTITLQTPNGLRGIPVASGGNYTDKNGQRWICDEVDLERGIYIKRVAVTVLTVDSVQALSQNTNDYCIVIKPPIDYKYVTDIRTVLMSNRFRYDKKLKNKGVIFGYGNQIRLYVDQNEIKTLDAAKEFIEKNQIEIMYEVNEHVETPLTPAELTTYKALTTYAPNTVVQASDGANIKLDYQRDVNLVVKNLEDAIASMTTT